MRRVRASVGQLASLTVAVWVAATMASRGQDVPPALSGTHAASSPSQHVAAAIDRAADYLVRGCDPQGRFAYQIHLDPQVELPPSYNILRHAGAIYALASYHEWSPRDDVRLAALRAARLLRERCLRTVADNPNLLAVWPLPGDAEDPREAKLGGAALGLVALLSVEPLQPGFTPPAELRKLGRFLLYMQKLDGSFHSKYLPPPRGRDDSWTSIYYPGEAALALLLLDDHQPATAWSAGAARAVGYLAQSQSSVRATIPDQWVLLASARLLPKLERNVHLPTNRATVLAHAQRTALDMVAEQTTQLADPVLRGCFTRDGRSCPSATRLEGLLAALSFWPEDDVAGRQRVSTAVELGIEFLLRCQVTEGPHAGAMPMAIRPLPDDGQQMTRRFNAQVGEVRIDYVQHALSALLAYERWKSAPRKSVPAP